MSETTNADSSSLRVSLTLVKLPFDIFLARLTIELIRLVVTTIINAVLTIPITTVNVRKIRENVRAFFKEMSNLSV
ncbi:hypothetical protein D3C86_1629390 [compost metagenome]